MTAIVGINQSDIGARALTGSDAIGSVGSIGGAGATSGTSGVGFGDVLAELGAQASVQHNKAATTADAVARGALDDLHGSMIAVKEAEISLKLMGSVRNKLLDAFQEIWRTNV